MRWELVGHSSHPIPDDPAVVANQIAHLRRVAASLETQLERLPTEEQAGSLVWDSDAAEGFRRVVAELPRDLGRLKARYARASDALDTFRDQLVATKAEAEEGVRAAEIADDAIRAAEAGVERMEEHARSAEGAADRINDAAEPGSPSVRPEPWSGPNHHAALDAARRDLERARERVHEAVRAFEDASDITADAIGDAIDDDLKNDDSLWGSIKRGADWMVDNLPIAEIASIAGKIAAVAGVLSLIPIPIFQQLAWVALGASALVVGATAVVMLDKRNDGEPLTAGDWASLGLAVASVGLGVWGVAASRAASAAQATAGTAAATSGVTARAANAATVSRVASQGQLSSAAARLGTIRSSGLFTRIVSRVLGRTGRAEQAVVTATRGVNAARAAEAEALAAHAVAQARAAEATNRAVQAVRASYGISATGVAYDTATLGRDMTLQGIPVEMIVTDPAGAFACSVEIDVEGIQAHGETRAAGDRGATITPQPVGP